VLNVGGGSKAHPLPERYKGWVHELLDIVDGPDVDVVCDARDMAEARPPLGPYDAVYTSHVLEHFYEHDVPRVLAGFAAVLCPGGLLEIHVPDLNNLARFTALEDVAYWSADGTRAIRFIDTLYGGAPEVRESEYMAHKTGFDTPRLRGFVEAAGFHVLEVIAENYDLALFAKLSSEPTKYEDKT
jgi:predicted SAM-dependent methyltransferase